MTGSQTPAKNKLVVTSVKFPPDLYAQLKTRAGAQDRSISRHIRHLVKRDLEEAA
jgi:hypothetical protein